MSPEYATGLPCGVFGCRSGSSTQFPTREPYCVGDLKSAAASTATTKTTHAAGSHVAPRLDHVIWNWALETQEGRRGSSKSRVSASCHPWSLYTFRSALCSGKTLESRCCRMRWEYRCAQHPTEGAVRSGHPCNMNGLPATLSIMRIWVLPSALFSLTKGLPSTMPTAIR